MAGGPTLTCDVTCPVSLCPPASAGSKPEVVGLWRAGRLQVFHEDGCRRCHGPINHKRWATAKEPYTVKWAQAFEPWGILARWVDWSVLHGT